MRCKKLVLAMVVVCAMFFSTTTMAQAAAAWVEGNLTQVAMNDGNLGWIVFSSNDGTLVNVPYILSSNNTNSLLATALTAQSAAKSVFIYVADTTPNSVCSAIGLKN